MKIRLEKGEYTQCPTENTELINGIPYEKVKIDDRAEDMVRHIYGKFLQYRLAYHPVDVIINPQAPLIIPELENSITRPEIAVICKGDTFPTWIVEFVDDESFEISMMLKPLLYRDAGTKEYWVIDHHKDIIYVFDLKNGFKLPVVYDNPRRIKVGVYKDFFISYSDLFKKK